MANQFTAVYTNADLAEDDIPQYDKAIFDEWYHRLESSPTSSTPGFSYAILCAILCTQRRGEAVGSLFQDATKHDSEEGVKKTFSLLRETITVISPWIGFSNCMSACFGLIGELKARQIKHVPEQERPGFSEVDYLEKGLETNTEIYRRVGSADARGMIGQFFPSLTYFTNVSTFGYVLGGSRLLPLKELECLVTASVIALGVTRQARTHSKATLQLGIDTNALEAIIDVAREMATWSRSQPSSVIEVSQLRAELDSGPAKR